LPPAGRQSRPAARLTAEQNRKIFLTFFNRPPRQNFFQLRKRKFFCFAFLLTQELRKRFPTPSPASRGRASGQKFIGGDDTQTPFSFCPPVWASPSNFFGGRATNQKG